MMRRALGLLLLAGQTLVTRPCGAQDPSASSVPRAARDIPRGAVLQATDVTAAPDRADSLVGWVARRVIRAGEMLRAPAIARPDVIVAGAPVTLQLSQGGVLATRTGTAIAGGPVGKRIRIRLDADRVIVATVSGPATVVVP